MSSNTVEFSHFIISLAQNVKEGFTEGTDSPQKTMAEYSLGVLKMLQSKTQGNLSDAEQKLLQALLDEFPQPQEEEK